jgi:hypothetical protein
MKDRKGRLVGEDEVLVSRIKLRPRDPRLEKFVKLLHYYQLRREGLI